MNICGSFSVVESLLFETLKMFGNNQHNVDQSTAASNSNQSSFGGVGLSGRVVSFSFKIEKSQLLQPKHQDYMLVNQDGSHCAGSAKFNGITSDFPMTGAAMVAEELAPGYSASATGFSSSYVKSEPNFSSMQEEQKFSQVAEHRQCLNDSGFVESDPNLFTNEHEMFDSSTIVPKMEPGYGH